MPIDDPVVLKTFFDEPSARIAASYLEAQGIEALVLADDAGGAYPPLHETEGIRIVVDRADHDEAARILDAVEAAPEPPAGDEEAP